MKRTNRCRAADMRFEKTTFELNSGEITVSVFLMMYSEYFEGSQLLFVSEVHSVLS